MVRGKLIGALVLEPEESRPLEVIETATFTKDVRVLLSDDQIEELKQEVSVLRQLGTVIKDTGGLRKFRHEAKGKGKRSGARVIYFYGGDHIPLLLVAIYAKSEKLDMTPAEKKAARKLIEAYEREQRRKNTQPKLRIVSGRRLG